MTTQQIHTEINRFVETGNEEQLREFFVKNFKSLPEAMQKKVFFGFVEEMLERQAAEAEIAKIQELGIKALEEIEAFKASLQKA